MFVTTRSDRIGVQRRGCRGCHVNHDTISHWPTWLQDHCCPRRCLEKSSTSKVRFFHSHTIPPFIPLTPARLNGSCRSFPLSLYADSLWIPNFRGCNSNSCRICTLFSLSTCKSLQIRRLERARVVIIISVPFFSGKPSLFQFVRCTLCWNPTMTLLLTRPFNRRS
jgi:hypothetical protein